MKMEGGEICKLGLEWVLKRRFFVIDERGLIKFGYKFMSSRLSVRKNCFSVFNFYINDNFYRILLE